jgi:hypothetical protein
MEADPLKRLVLMLFIALFIILFVKRFSVSALLHCHKRQIMLLLEQPINHLRCDVGKRSISLVYIPEMPLVISAEVFIQTLCK